VGDADADGSLAALVDEAIEGRTDGLRAYLFAGCRAGLDPALETELEPWITQWDFETQAMQYALVLIDQRPQRPASTAFVLSELWSRARQRREQLFGVRWAYYPVTARQADDADVEVEPAALVEGENLTDRLCRAALTWRG
jgi:hypothetical protein